MDFQNPKVKRATIEHIKFAFMCVNEAIGNEKIKDKSQRQLTMAMRQVAASVLLGQTLQRDFRLWNSLNEVKQSTLQPGTNIEDVTL